jgi:O-antigen/teichoic acid export membrane protein
LVCRKVLLQHAVSFTRRLSHQRAELWAPNADDLHVSLFSCEGEGIGVQSSGLIRRYLEHVWHSPFTRSVAVVTTGTVGAQAITIVFSPIITRIYGPDAFGLLGTFMAILSIVIPIATLGYSMAIVLSRDDRDALGLVRLSLQISFVMALTVSTILWFGGSWLITSMSIEVIGDYLFLIPVAMLFSAWVQIAHQWLIRKKEFRVIAKVAVSNSLILNFAKSGIGWFSPLAAVLIGLAAIGNLLNALQLSVSAVRRYRSSAIQPEKTAPGRIGYLAHFHRDFPLYRTPQNLINAASQSLPILMLAAFFGPAPAGFYTLGKVVMGVPSVLVGNSFADVFYPRITEAAYAGEDLRKAIINATGVLALLGIVPFGLVILVGPWLFSFVFGSEWRMAGEYGQWLALFFFSNFINKPCVSAVPVLGIQRGLLIYELFSTGGKAAGLIVGFYFFENDLWAIALFSVVGVVAYAAMMLWIIGHAARWGSHAKTS